MATPTAATPATFNPYDYCKVVKSRGGKTFPDFYNSLPIKPCLAAMLGRQCSPYYADFSPCRCGHVCGRMTANSQCIDCHRIKKGLTTIGDMAKDRVYYKPRAEKTSMAAAHWRSTAATSESLRHTQRPDHRPPQRRSWESPWARLMRASLPMPLSPRQ